MPVDLSNLLLTVCLLIGTGLAGQAGADQPTVARSPLVLQWQFELGVTEKFPDEIWKTANSDMIDSLDQAYVRLNGAIMKLQEVIANDPPPTDPSMYGAWEMFTAVRQQERRTKLRALKSTHEKMRRALDVADTSPNARIHADTPADEQDVVALTLARKILTCLDGAKHENERLDEVKRIIAEDGRLNLLHYELSVGRIENFAPGFRGTMCTGDGLLGRFGFSHVMGAGEAVLNGTRTRGQAYDPDRDEVRYPACQLDLQRENSEVAFGNSSQMRVTLVYRITSAKQPQSDLGTASVEHVSVHLISGMWNLPRAFQSIPRTAGCEEHSGYVIATQARTQTYLERSLTLPDSQEPSPIQRDVTTKDRVRSNRSTNGIAVRGTLTASHLS